MKTKNKIISIITALAIAVPLTACGVSTESVVNTTTAETTPAPPTTVEDYTWTVEGALCSYTGEIDSDGYFEGKGTLTVTYTGDASGLVKVYNGTMSKGNYCNGVFEYFYNNKSMGLTSVVDGVESESDKEAVSEAIQKENGLWSKIKNKAGELWESVKEGVSDGIENLF